MVGWGRFSGAVVLCLALMVAPSRAQQPDAGEQKTALVIGNAAYPTAPLRNPVNDARDMAAKLTQLGFRVTLLENATNREMARAIGAFGLAIAKGGVGLFYYSGHGLQVTGFTHEWAAVDRGGRLGFVHRKFITAP